MLLLYSDTRCLGAAVIFFLVLIEYRRVGKERSCHTVAVSVVLCSPLAPLVTAEIGRAGSQSQIYNGIFFNMDFDFRRV